MNNLKTIGVFLKDARTAKNLSLEEISSKTKINLKLLNHLENDQLTNLPNKTYVVGFVKNYAKNLDLNEEEALLSLNYTYEQKLDTPAVKNEVFIKDEEVPTDLEDSAKAVFKSFYNKKVFIAVVASVILIFVVKSTVSFFSNIAKEKVSFEKSEVLKPLNESDNTNKLTVTDNETESENTTEPEVNDKELKTSSDLEAKQDKKNIETDVKTETKEQIVKKEDVKKEPEPKVVEEKKPEPIKNLNGKYPYINFYPVPNDLYSLSSDAEEVNDPAILPARYKNAVEDGKQNVYIHATIDDTWISFKVDGQKIKRYVLKKGRSVLLKGDVVLLFMGNINATKIFLNNQLVQTDSKTGVKSLVFPESSASDYELPLFPTYKYQSFTSKEYKENMVEKAN